MLVATGWVSIVTCDPTSKKSFTSLLSRSSIVEYPEPEVTLPSELTIAGESLIPSPSVSTESPRIPSPSGSR